MGNVDDLSAVRVVAIDQDAEAVGRLVSDEEANWHVGCVKGHRTLAALVQVRRLVLPLEADISLRRLDRARTVTTLGHLTVAVDVKLPSYFPLGRAGLIVVVPLILQAHVSLLAPTVRVHQR